MNFAEMIKALLPEVAEIGEDWRSEDFIKREFDVYYNLARLIDPISVLEVGVYKGYSACAIALGSPRLLHYLGLDAQLYLKNSNTIARKMIKRFQEKYNLQYPTFWVEDCDTVNGSPLSHVQHYCSAYGSRGFDWVHIDGAHDKEGAIKDILTFWPYTKSFMTIHDYEETHKEVIEAVDEVLKNELIKGVKSQLLVSSGHNFFVLQKEGSAR